MQLRVYSEMRREWWQPGANVFPLAELTQLCPSRLLLEGAASTGGLVATQLTHDGQRNL